MAVRKPLVIDAGRPRQLVSGDVLAGLPVSLPVRNQAGTVLRAVFDASYNLPVKLQGGATLTAAVTTS
ncbi:hypothetical protein [Diaphorobacter caeni]|uniref:hypothetical protein n=1 Tax=Diaphorobacter caeni TaxID=2784387 RepID=UPI00188DE1B8|nr:hypothetical protein [Diaphorobacter caeni]MBF5006834.1 hypothetical protein [Diaphorobacter caeni]